MSESKEEDEVTEVKNIDKQQGVFLLLALPEDHPDGLKQKVVEEDGDVLTTIYADDTQSRTSAKKLKELDT